MRSQPRAAGAAREIASRKPAGGNAAAGSNGRVDREKHCPFLLRVFCSVGGSRRKEDYEELESKPIADELHIYTWPDATLRELADLVQDANAEAQKPNVRMSISIVSLARDGRVIMRKAGFVHSNRRKPSADGDKTLAAMHFQPGDYLDIALLS